MAPWFLLVLALGGAPAGRDAARRFYQQGTAAYEKRQYEEALGDFEQAYEAAPLGQLLYDIAQCHRGLGQWKEARDNYLRYLKAEPAAKNRERAWEHLAEVEAKLLPEASKAPVATEPVAAPPAQASPIATPSGGVSEAQVPAAALEAPAVPRSHAVRRGPLWLGGAGLACAALGGVALFEGLSLASGVPQARTGSSGQLVYPITTGQYRQLQGSANAWGYGGEALLGAGGALLVTAAVWALWPHGKAR